MTNQSVRDWAPWGLESSTTAFNHKAANGSAVGLISNYTKLGTSTLVGAGNNSVYYTWADGTPTTSTTRSSNYVQASGQNAGFRFSVPTDTTMRTLKVYVSAESATGSWKATLSDGSAATYTTSITGGNKVVTITFKAGSAGQTLSVDWTQASTTGFITLQAAVLP